MAFRVNDFLLENFVAAGTFLMLASRLRAGGLFIRYPLKESDAESAEAEPWSESGLQPAKASVHPAAIAANDKRIRIFDFFITVSSLFLWIFESL